MSLALTFILPPTPASAASLQTGQATVVPEAPCTETLGDFSDLLSHYNLITINDLSTSSDVEGRTFVGGTISNNGMTIGNQLPGDFVATDISLEIVGTIGGGGSVNVIKGSARVGNTNSVAFTAPNNQYTVNGVRLFDMSQGNSGANVAVDSGLASKQSQIADTLNAASSLLAAAPANNTATMPGSLGPLTLVVNNKDANGLAVFNLSASQLLGATVQSIEIQNNANAETILINVSGSSVNWPGGKNLLGNWLNDASEDGGRARTLWNFHEATSISMGVNFKGALLAPKAALNAGSQNLDGAVAVKSLTNPGEVHLPVFSGNVTSTCPETGGLNLVKTDDEGEPIADWEMCIYTVGAQDTLGDLIDCKETDANGKASFAGLALDNYYACEVLETGWTLVDPASPDLETSADGNDLACQLVEVDTPSVVAGPESVELTIGGNTFTVEFEGVSNNGLTWTYHVDDDGGSPDLSHWVLGLGLCIEQNDIANTSPTYESLGNDGSTGFYGLKWDTDGGLPGAGSTFSITFNQVYSIGTIEALVKAGPSDNQGFIAGPDCTPPSDPIVFKNQLDSVPPLDITKTAETAWEQEYTWEIVKSVDQNEF
ncbi:MAG: choice-of-anchor A family protein, partial [Litorilinea sp.]